MTPSTSAKSIQYPSQEVADKIGQLPKFSADVSLFHDQNPDQIADWAEKQGDETILNISHATPEELAKFKAANELLKDRGQREMVLFDEKTRVNEITRQISAETVTLAHCYRAFVEAVLKKPELAVTEFNVFGTRGPGFEDLHYWDNAGLANQEDPLRTDVTQLLDTTAEQFKEEFETRVRAELKEHPEMKEDSEKFRNLLLGLFSDMVRGHFYKHANPDKVKTYELRAIAVEVVERMLKEQKA